MIYQNNTEEAWLTAIDVSRTAQAWGHGRQGWGGGGLCSLQPVVVLQLIGWPHIHAHHLSGTGSLPLPPGGGDSVTGEGECRSLSQVVVPQSLKGRLWSLVI